MTSTGIFQMAQDELILAIGLIIIAILMLWYYAVTAKRLRKFFFGVASGLLILFPAQWIVAAMGGFMTVNLFTTTVAALLGIPGVALMCLTLFI